VIERAVARWITAKSSLFEVPVTPNGWNVRMEMMWPLVEAQHSVFGRWQAREHGITWRELDRLVRMDVLERATSRVLRVRGAQRTPEQDLMIRVLDAGYGAAATRRGAAWAWGVPGFVPGYFDVARRREHHARAGATSRWPRLLPEHHLTVVRGIVVTTLARTMFDLAGMPKYAWRIGPIIDSVAGKSPSLLVAMHQMLPELAKQGRNGIVAVREALAERPPDVVKLTGLERKFEHILRRAGLAVPRRQIDLGGHSWFGRVDYYDDPIKVIYEVDSEAHHTTETDTRNDALRDAAAIEAGFNEVVRIPEEHVWYEPHLVVSTVMQARARWRRAA
jgi:very-short-patch-repair endonuclease